jgi:3-hydroxyacyl-[acyl-carrier-protein] dehydratase
MESLTPAQILDLLPQKAPFLFVDRLVSITDDEAVCEYTFRQDEVFYPGHFPGHPITPGVILVELLGQVASALAIHLMAKDVPPDALREIVHVFTDFHAESFSRFVRPGESVRAAVKKVHWRRRSLRATGEVTMIDGTPVCEANVGLTAVFRGTGERVK